MKQFQQFFQCYEQFSRLFKKCLHYLCNTYIYLSNPEITITPSINSTFPSHVSKKLPNITLRGSTPFSAGTITTILIINLLPPYHPKIKVNPTRILIWSIVGANKLFLTILLIIIYAFLLVLLPRAFDFNLCHDDSRRESFNDFIFLIEFSRLVSAKAISRLYLYTYII